MATPVGVQGATAADVPPDGQVSEFRIGHKPLISCRLDGPILEGDVFPYILIPPDCCGEDVQDVFVVVGDINQALGQDNILF